MNLRLFATACVVATLSLSPVAYAQQTVGPVTGDPTLANSQSGAASNAANTNANTVGPIDNSHGAVTTGPSSADSTSGANSNSVGVNTNLNGGNTVGPIDSSVRLGPQTATSNSDAVSGSSSTAITRSEGGSVGDTTAQSAAQGGAGGAGGQGGAGTANSSATGGTSSASTGPSSSNQTQEQSADNQGNAQNITFNSVAPKHTKLETNPTVYAPALSTTLTETCMGSTSGGISVLGFGGTLGTTWNDNQCVRRLNAREMAQTFGDREAGRALLCQDKDVAEAYRSVGQDCHTAWQPRTAMQYNAPPAIVQSEALPPPPPPVQYSAPPSKPAATMKPIPNPAEAGERGALTYKEPRG